MVPSKIHCNWYLFENAQSCVRGGVNVTQISLTQLQGDPLLTLGYNNGSQPSPTAETFFMVVSVAFNDVANAVGAA